MKESDNVHWYAWKLYYKTLDFCSIIFIRYLYSVLHLKTSKTVNPLPLSLPRYFWSARACTYSKTFRCPCELYSIPLVLRSNLTSLKILWVEYFLSLKTCYRTYHFRQNRRCLRTSWCFRLTRIAKNTKLLSVAKQISSYCFYFVSDQNCDWHFLVWYSNHSEWRKVFSFHFPGYPIISNDNRLL